MGRCKRHGKSVIDADVWTHEQLSSGVGDFLYLYSHMASKTMCEAVVEGMGAMWDLCSSDNRHLSLQSAAEEALVAWSAPHPWHPEAVTFINHSLNHFVGKDSDGKQKKWKFTHNDTWHKGKSSQAHSQVVERLKKDPLRLPSAMYDVAAE